jgi:hypothetical protein
LKDIVAFHPEDMDQVAEECGLYFHEVVTAKEKKKVFFFFFFLFSEGLFFSIGTQGPAH